MTHEEKIAFKQQLKQFARTIIEERMTASEKAMNNAQQAANNEEKSSAGDKYETARAMGHLEKDMHARQLAEHMKDLNKLLGIDVNNICMGVVTGALVQCNNIYFFIAAGLGKQDVAGKQVIFLSPQAPLVKSLQGKKPGDELTFNARRIAITDIY
jgi:IS5 family transposase